MDNVIVNVQHGKAEGQLSQVIFAVSFELKSALQMLLADLHGVIDLRLLENECPKLFVVTRGDDIERDHKIVQRMIQVEDIQPCAELNYDIVPEEQAHFIPDAAKSIK